MPAAQAGAINRRDKSYYVPYQHGTLLPAAEKLQDARLTQTRELQRIRFAAYGLAFTIVGLIIKLMTERTESFNRLHRSAAGSDNVVGRN